MLSETPNHTDIVSVLQQNAATMHKPLTVIQKKLLFSKSKYLKTDIFPKLAQATKNFPHGEKHWQNTVVYSSSLALAFLFCNMYYINKNKYLLN